MVEIHYGQLNEEIQENATGFISNAFEGLSIDNISELINNNELPNYMSFDGDGINLDNKNSHFYSEGDFTGYISSEISDEDCNTVGGMAIWLPSQPLDLRQGVTFSFYGNCCAEILVMCRNRNTESYYEETIYVNTPFFCWEPPEEIFYEDLMKIEFWFQKTVLPRQFIKLAYIKFGKITVFNKLKNVEVLEETNVLSDDLPINALNFSVVIKDDFDFNQDDSINIYSNRKYYGTFYLEDFEKISKNIYQLKCLSCVQKLENTDYDYWTPDLQIAPDDFSTTSFSEEIFNVSGVKIIPEKTAIRCFGQIPVETSRRALCLYAFASCMMIDESRNNKIILRSLPNNITSIITTESKRIIGESTFEKTSMPSSTKLQFAKQYDSEGKVETVKLVNKANKRTKYYFPDFYVELWEEQPADLTIYSWSSNFVEFVSTKKNASLNVMKYNILYESIELNNSLAIKKGNKNDYTSLNLSATDFSEAEIDLSEQKKKDIMKFMKSTGKVKAKIILQNERIGDLIQIETAYDGIKTGIITSMAISFGYKDVADIEVLEWPNG